MARFTQYIGLSPQGREIVKDAELVTTYVGGTGIAFEPVEFGVYKKDKTLLIEVLQKEIWSSGPMYFTCLLDPTNYSYLLAEWTEEEIDKYF